MDMMSLRHRVLLHQTNGGGSLPVGYTQLEFVEFPGGSAFVTNATYSPSSVFEADFIPAIGDSTYESIGLFGSSANMNDRPIWMFQGVFWYRIGNGGREVSTGKSVVVGDRYVVTAYENEKYIINSDEYSVDYARADGANVIIGSLYSASNNTFSGIVYTLKIKQDGTYAKIYVPARKDSTGEVGFYETVGGEFLAPEGNPLFNRDVVEGYDYKFSPYNGDLFGDFNVKKIPVTAGQIITVKNYGASKKGYLYDARNVGGDYKLGRLAGGQTYTINVTTSGDFVLFGFRNNPDGAPSPTVNDRYTGQFVTVSIS